jgi:predicted nuclease of predicted toxin-antitoxin system
MWLLDANMDVHVLDVLKELGIPCESAIHRGWTDLTNGELVSAALKAGFVCILTQDRSFGRSAGSSLKAASNFSIVVIHLPQKPWREYIVLFRELWSREPIMPTPGSVVHWPSSQS